MRPRLVLALTVAALLGSAAMFAVTVSNHFETLDQEIELASTRVEVAYRLRANDLVPRFLDWVKCCVDPKTGYVDRVKEAQAQVMSESATVLTDIAQFEKSQRVFGDAILTLINDSRRYRFLRAKAGFRDLVFKLANPGNRVNVEVERFNEAVDRYNSYLQAWPPSLIARFEGLVPRQKLQLLGVYPLKEYAQKDLVGHSLE